MARQPNQPSPRSGAILPLGLLLAVVGAISGVVVWLSLFSDGGSADSLRRGTEVAVTLAPGANKPGSGNKTDLAGSLEPPEAEAPRELPALTPPRPQPELPAEIKPAKREAPIPAEPAPVAPASVAPTPVAPGSIAKVAPPPEPMPVKPAQKPAAQNPEISAITAAPVVRIAPPLVVAPVMEVKPQNPVMRPKLPEIQSGPPLSVAPDPALVQRSGLGPLPRIGDDGREPSRVYARPFDRSDKRPRIALIVTGLGLSSAATNAAIQSLPGGVTLAFAPYADRLGEWIRLARAAGHEALLNVPMEPVNYPEYDPGPQTLLTTLSSVENRDRLLWTLSRATGYVGIIDFMGSRFTTSRGHIRPVLATLKNRGLIFINSQNRRLRVMTRTAAEIGTPWAAVNKIIDERASRNMIDKRLKELEIIARNTKMAIGMGSPYPVTLERVALWAQGLEKRGIALAPVSAMIDRGDKK